MIPNSAEGALASDSIADPSELLELSRKLAASGVADAEREAAQIVSIAGGDRARTADVLARRMAGEPLEMILGWATFMGLNLRVGRGALVPRRETELLARTAIATLAEARARRPRIVDMCCGVGNLALALAHHVPEAQVWAADLTDACVALARENAKRLGLADRVVVAQGDLFHALAGHGLEGNVDMIVCNPPYISTGRLAADRAPLLRHEPREAFDAGPYGLSIHQRVVAEAARYLRRDGWLLCEFGAGQSKQIKILFDRSRRYAEVRMIPDESGDERAAAARSLG